MASCVLHHRCNLASHGDKLNDVPSSIMQALYEGRRDDAIAVASGATLDHFEAAALGESERLRELVDADASVARVSSDDGFTALHYAAFFGTSDCAAVLIGGGADVASVAANGMKVQPLHSAAASRSTTISRLLLAAGAPPNAVQTGGYTPLHEAALHADRDLIDLLLSYGAIAGVANDQGQTPADLARSEGHDDIAQELEARLGS
jgi:ankyrin repeat protein